MKENNAILIYYANYKYDFPYEVISDKRKTPTYTSIIKLVNIYIKLFVLL